MPLKLSPDLDYYGGMDMKHIGDLTPDPRNARKHGERNIGQIERSLEAYGAARSIVVDETGRILAGNGLVEAAANVGIEAVRTVESNGNEIIAVVRRGLTEEQKLGLAIADNSIEGFWSMVKRAWYGQHHHYSVKYMNLYISEACYKYNQRKTPVTFDGALSLMAGA